MLAEAQGQRNEWTAKERAGVTCLAENNNHYWKGEKDQYYQFPVKRVDVTWENRGLHVGFLAVFMFYLHLGSHVCTRRVAESRSDLLSVCWEPAAHC